MKRINKRSILAVLFLISFCAGSRGQSATVKRLELKRLALQNKYRSVGNFDTLTGIATVYQDGRMGYIDTNGRLILPINYVTKDFSDGLGFYEDIAKHTFTIIDRTGKVIRQISHIISWHGFDRGRFFFSARKEGNILYGVMDTAGNILIDNKYPYIEKISEKYYYVNSNKDGAGIINYRGETIIPLQYAINYIDTSDLHFIGYRADTGYALFDSSGRIRKFWGREVYPESSRVEGRHYFQRDSVIIIKDQWSSSGAKTALVNLNLDTIIPMGRYTMSVINEGLIRFHQSIKARQLDDRVTISQVTRCGFLNTKGEIVIPAKFDYAQYFTEGLCAVQLNDKWGYIDRKGSIVIPLKFDYALPFSSGYAKVQVNKQFFIIDRQGKIVLDSKPN